MRDFDMLKMNIYVDTESDIPYLDSTSMTRVARPLGNDPKDAIIIITTW